MPLSALLLDLDGTLLDSNAVHAEAWRRAAEAAGVGHPRERFDRAIGEGGDQLVPDVFGDAFEAAHGDALRDAYTRHVRRLLDETGVAVFDGAEALIAEAAARGLALALATSAAEADLDALFEAAGVDLRDRVDVVITSSDVADSKPAPDVVAVAVEKLGLAPEDCALVGDTVYDAAAARKAGVAFVGVATWVWDAEALREAGAGFVAPSTAALASGLDEALAAVAS